MEGRGLYSVTGFFVLMSADFGRLVGCSRFCVFDGEFFFLGVDRCVFFTIVCWLFLVSFFWVFYFFNLIEFFEFGCILNLVKVFGKNIDF